jgi:hypothetical protein
MQPRNLLKEFFILELRNVLAGMFIILVSLHLLSSGVTLTSPAFRIPPQQQIVGWLAKLVVSADLVVQNYQWAFGVEVRHSSK